MPDFRVRAVLLCAALLPLAASGTNSSAAAPATAETSAALDAQTQFAVDLAREHGLKAQDVLDTLSKARYQQSVIDAISRPAESKTWKEYRPIFVNERRIADGVAFARTHATLLRRIETAYGVPAAVIVAIIGVETNYGRNAGRYHVLDALTTLAFHYPPRADFFRAELQQLFLLRGANFPYPLEELTGSYAGAMGWGQFMPSSIARFARDGDDDGKVDLWNSPADVFASVANYFIAHGWQKDGPVALRATIAAQAHPLAPSSLEPVYSLQQLGASGYSAAGKLDPMLPATVVTLEGEDGSETWIAFQNFYVISRYNRSPLYSLAVYQLSQAIAAGLETAAP